VTGARLVRPLSPPLTRSECSRRRRGPQLPLPPSDASDRQADEVRALKDKFGQEMRLADEANERIRAVHTNTHLEQLHLLRQSEQEAVAALLAKQQHELDGLIQAQSRELERARSDIDRQFEEWKESLKSQVRPAPPPPSDLRPSSGGGTHVLQRGRHQRARQERGRDGD
jgi:hypothetical protein